MPAVAAGAVSTDAVGVAAHTDESLPLLEIDKSAARRAGGGAMGYHVDANCGRGSEAGWRQRSSPVPVAANGGSVVVLEGVHGANKSQIRTSRIATSYATIFNNSQANSKKSRPTLD